MRKSKERKRKGNKRRKGMKSNKRRIRRSD